MRTTFGTFEASLTCSAGMRTLDAVNQLSSSVVILRAPVVPALGPPFGPGRLAIVKSSILFVQELETPPATSGSRPRCRFWQSPVALRVGEFIVEGSVHVPIGGDPLLRIHQSGPAFLALTSVVARASGSEFEAPFLAVNRFQIAAAQKLPEREENPVGRAADVETGPVPAS